MSAHQNLMRYNQSMPHIHTAPGQHDPTASAYIIRIDGDEPLLLLHKHKLLDSYLQIGGHIELDETPWQAIVHEIKEESGYRMNQLRILQPKVRLKSITNATVHPQPAYVITHPFKGKDHYHTDAAYVFVTNEAPADNVSEGESNELRWFTDKELDELTTDEIIENVREIGHFVMRVYLKEGEAIQTAEFGSHI